MNRPLGMGLLALLCAGAASGVVAEETPLPQAWDYARAMQEVATRGTGREGLVLHVGDSITYANPYGQWARAGEGRSPEDLAALAWMHAGADDDGDGWWLARVDHPDGGRSATAAGGLRADALLAGGRNGLPPFADLLEQYRPQLVVLMLGTNDASEGRDVASYAADMARAVDLALGRGVVVIVSTIPPHPARRALAASYNEALRRLARARGLPLIDFEREILGRRPDDWDGTLLGRGDVHPSADQGGVTPTSAPSAANLRESGYLLRGWLSVRKVAEVRRAVFNPEQVRPVAEAATTEKPAVARPRPDEAVRVAVTRDAWFSDVGTEADGSNGGASRLKLKTYQEMSLIDIDPAPLRERAIRSATLHLRSAGEPRLLRVTVGSFGADWVEGTATGYALEPGSSTFHHKKHPDVPWTVPGSDLCAVMLGQGGTTWRMADASPPDAKGWQEIAVDPTVLAARVAGVSYGFLLFDDTGSEWTRRGESFTPRPMPNRFVSSRESNRSSAPYLTVALGPKDDAPRPPRKGSRRTRPNYQPARRGFPGRPPPTSGRPGRSGFSPRSMKRFCPAI